MTRIAIVASSEKLRLSLATALRTNPDFEVVGVAASSAEIPPSADVVLIARPSATATGGRRISEGDSLAGTVLSNREREILALLADGLVNKQIAARLGISTNTVKTHLELLFAKLDVTTRAEAVATGVKRGLLLL
ncbi:MAG: response regulator transcription factor [Gemmatimonadaceae bacterium]